MEFKPGDKIKLKSMNKLLEEDFQIYRDNITGKNIWLIEINYGCRVNIVDVVTPYVIIAKDTE